ncbi:MAG: hypothetical protein AAFZ09_13310, partial [Pseudomonadota bacterium]
PDVALTKTAVPAAGDAGDEITFRVEVTNQPLTVGGEDRSASAFDLVITDILDDPDLVFVEGSVVLSGDAAGAASIVLGDDPGETTIEVTLDELATGETLVIEYRAIIPDDVVLGETLTNTADARFDSLPFDDDPAERDGTVSDTAEVAVAAPELSKRILSTSFAETSGNDLAIGETVVFEIEAVIPEGEAPIIIEDRLPTRPGVLSFVSAEVTGIGSDLLASSALAVGATAVPVGGVIRFDFGTLENLPDGDTLDESITIEVTALVEDLPENTGGDRAVNRASLVFGLGPDDVVTARRRVDIVEPEIAIDKTAPAGPADSGDVLDYSFEVTNTGGAPAFDLVVSDLLDDPGLDLVAGSIIVSDPAAVVTPSGDGFTVTLDQFDDGATLSVTYQVTVAEGVVFTTTLPNTATVERFDTNPSDDPAAPARTTVFDPFNPDPDLVDTEEVP